MVEVLVSHPCAGANRSFSQSDGNQSLESDLEARTEFIKSYSKFKSELEGTKTSN